MPGPYPLAPSFTFEGSDGNWTTFEISVGSPPQNFRIIPSTAVSETWIPIPQGCQGVLEGLPGCGDLRGVDDVNGSPSLGFQTNTSTTWSTIGIYDLVAGDSLFDSASDTGLYGTDVITIPRSTAGDPAKLEAQVVAGVASANVWHGVMGLQARSANFSVQSENLPSLIDAMKRENVTSSLSFGYTAGAAYASPAIPGNLVLGGYDQARFEATDISFATGGKDNTTLPLRLHSIIADSLPSGTLSLLPNGQPITVTIDSTVSQMHLPQGACDLFEKAFGLTYDADKDFYLVNDSAHSELVQSNPSVTFTIGDDTGPSDVTTNIVLPYAAFDLAVGIPFYNNDTRYFPLRVAKDESQQVLGRAFLQEAYVVVDWERNNFTVAQAIHQRAKTDIKEISPVSARSSSGSSGLSTGAIAGIAVGAVAGIIADAVAAFFFVRARRERRTTTVAPYYADFPPDDKPGVGQSDVVEVHDSQVFELQEGNRPKFELHSGSYVPVPELDGDISQQTELEDTSSKRPLSEKEKTVYEMP